MRAGRALSGKKDISQVAHLLDCVHVLLHCFLQIPSIVPMPTVCKCKECSLYQYQAIDGTYKRGRKVSAGIARAHKQEAVMRQKVQNEARHSRERSTRESQTKEQTDKATAENAIFLAAFQNERSQELPVRGRDSDTPYSRSGTVNVSGFVVGWTGVLMYPFFLVGCQLFTRSSRECARKAIDGDRRTFRIGRQARCNRGADRCRGTSWSYIRCYTYPQSSQVVHRRTRELGALESSITLRSRQISTYIALKFESRPVSDTDSPAELDRSDSNSAMLLRHRSWVVLELSTLRQLSPVNDKQADKHLEVLIHKFREEISRLDGIIERAWRKEMAAVGILRVVDQGVLPPIVVPRGTLDCDSHSAKLSDVHNSRNVRYQYLADPSFPLGWLADGINSPYRRVSSSTLHTVHPFDSASNFVRGVFVACKSLCKGCPECFSARSVALYSPRRPYSTICFPSRTRSRRLCCMSSLLQHISS